MSLQVNFTAHGHDLRAAYEAILRPADPQTSDNWAMFGYDKGSNDLKVLGQGSGGLEELEDEFADGKIQYAFVRIIDPNTQLNKFILIGWVSASSPSCPRERITAATSRLTRVVLAGRLQQQQPIGGTS